MQDCPDDNLLPRLAMMVSILVLASVATLASLSAHHARMGTCRS
jgi:hypothetical protein